MSPAKQAAVKLIVKYVERGDSLQSLRDGHQGSSAPGGMSAQIGGYMPVGGKSWSPDWILVHRDINGRVVDQAFKLKDIYRLCQSKQLTLL